MNLTQKPFYFITDRETLYQYFVDNISGKRYIYYPKEYEKMTENQINKYQRSMVRKFIWWSLWNKDKMETQDWMLCFTHTLDIVGFIGLGLFLAKVTKNFLFRTDFIGIEHLL